MTPRDSVRLARRMLDKGQLDKADKWTRSLVEKRPGDIRILVSRGFVLQRLCQPEAAAAHFRKAVLIDPGIAKLWSNVGNAERYLGRLLTAARANFNALILQPESMDTAFGLAVDQLARGDLLNGFRTYERRRPKINLRAKLKKRGMTIWTDEPVAGKSVLLLAEQGAGDTIQFARYAKLLADQGAEVSVACRPALTRLLSGVDGVSRTVHGFDQNGDFIELLMSLPARLGTTLENIPAPRRYLTPPPPPIRLPEGEGARIGIAWAGNPEHTRDPWRSIPAERLAPLLEIPGTRFFSLQVAAPETNRMPPHLLDKLVDLEPHVGDFADTAALIDQMDLVITIDSSVAHMAGALGIPCWILLSYVTDWRWLRDRTDSPWYPSVRLVRQNRPGDWDEAIGRVATALRVVVEGA